MRTNRVPKDIQSTIKAQKRVGAEMGNGCFDLGKNSRADNSVEIRRTAGSNVIC